MMASYVQVENLSKSYNKKCILDNISFHIAPGEFLVLVGPSGCGKSTALRCIAGLEVVDSGSIKIDDVNIIGLPPKDREIAMVFQEYALYPHKTVFENIGFSLKIRKEPKSVITQKVNEVAEELDLTKLLDCKPSELSGGQRQRVAIGRAIIRHPKVFLFDEPLSNLDAKLRGSMRRMISNLQSELNTTTIYVTHDQIEAMTLADKIIVLDKGVIQQIGKPMDIYHYPENIFVASFIGTPPINLLKGSFQELNSKLVFTSEKGFQLSAHERFYEHIVKSVKPNQKVVLGLRAQNLKIPVANSTSDHPYFKAKVLFSERTGPGSLATCEISGHEMQFMFPEPHRPQKGDQLELEYRSRHCYLFDANTTKSFIFDRVV